MYVGLFLTVLSLYSSYVYPSFSPAFGGGKAKSAEFIAKSSSVATLTNIGIPVEPNTRRSTRVQVIFEASDFFLIEAPTDLRERDRVQSIRLDKNLIEAVLYLGGD